MSSPADTLHPELGLPLEGTARLLRTRVLARLAGLRGGQLRLQDREGVVVLGQADGRDPLQATLHVRDADFYRQVGLNGSVGAAEAYMEGHWHSDDLVTLVRLLVRNRDLLDGMEGGWARLGAWALKAWHGLRRNTRSGSRRNIAAHYDLGNELFRLFLDERMMYSSAIFAPGDTLDQASVRKLDRVCQRLELGPDDHLLEIGTGWGGMAIHAATHYGCRVTTTTISREQHALATERIATAGLSDRIDVRLEDYRDLRGRFDKLVSIEMVEAVGHQYLDTYFARCAALLRPGGLALVQAITIEDDRYERALSSVDFIKRHIFPGSFIPCVSVLVDAAARAGALRLLALDDIGSSYAQTLLHWRQRFHGRLDEVRALGYDDRFVRMWEFYLCYCEGGFREQSISNVQMLFGRAGVRCRAHPPAP